MSPTDSFKQIRALIVDDDLESCNYAGVLFERLGVCHHAVTSGEAALEELGDAEDRGESYNLCMVDWKMPGMNGVEVADNIRNIFGDDTYIIIVSAYDINEIEAGGKKSGADYFISKPLFQSTIFDILSESSNGKYQECVEEKQVESDSFDFAGRKVLVAEDVTLNMEVAVELLSMVNLKVVCAEDGEIAVDIFNRSEIGEYAAVLMDINMPNMDGYTATRTIRACNRADAKTIPIFAMTANAFTEDVTAALNAGMNGHIAKPIEPDILYKTLDQAFREED